MPIVVEADDPRRCQGNMSKGQCTMEALPGFAFCKMHNLAGERREEKKQVRNLQVTIWQDRINALADSPQAKSLREEIGVLRLMLEAMLNNCQTSIDLLAMSNKIADLVSRIEKVVSSCHQLERASGQLLDKSAALQLASSFLDIIGELCTNPDEVAAIADAITAKVAEAKSVPSNK